MKPVEISFTPVDNQRLANLCGALDENLRQIETALDVNIARRGERFAMQRRAGAGALAAKLLRALLRPAPRATSRSKTCSSA